MKSPTAATPETLLVLSWHFPESSQKKFEHKVFKLKFNNSTKILIKTRRRKSRGPGRIYGTFERKLTLN